MEGAAWLAGASINGVQVFSPKGDSLGVIPTSQRPQNLAILRVGDARGLLHDHLWRAGIEVAGVPPLGTHGRHAIDHALASLSRRALTSYGGAVLLLLGSAQETDADPASNSRLRCRA